MIPPGGLDVEQAAFRAAMDVRDRLERGDLGAASVEAAADWRDAYDGDFEGLGDDAVAAFEDAFGSLADGDAESAIARLRETFESVCERDDPTLDGGDHVAACHRVGDD